jgi:TetR/AcrR family transcriptional regulator, cholesterol catabolism regulator
MSSPKSQKSGISNPEDRYIRILDVAARLFEKVGFPNTTVREIAAQVDIKSASIFYHFKDKDELLFKVMENTIIAVLDRQCLALDETGDLKRQLRALIKVEMDSFLIRREAQSFETLIHEWRHLKPEGQAKLLKLRAEYEANWNRVLDACVTSGLLSADRRVTRRILNGAFAWTSYWFQEEAELTFEQVIEEVMKLLVR